MRNLLLSVVLIALPVGVFTVVETAVPHAGAKAAVRSSGLGDLARYQTIVTDTQAIAAKGDLAAAATRITDFETLWDQEQGALRPKDNAAWGHIDDSADAVFSALRAGKPEAGQVAATLAALSAALDNGGAVSGNSGGVVVVAGIAVSDETGHPLPCEQMLSQLKAAAGSANPANAVKIADYQTKGTERCNADDDRHADEFFAQGIALAKG